MKAVLQYVLRTLMKDKTGIVQTMPKKEMVDFNVAMTAERLMRNGFDPNAFKNADQVENAIKQIEAPKVDVISQGDPRFEGIMNQLIGKKGEVFDMQGNKIDPRSKIMGGKQSETEAEIAERLGRENKEAAKRFKDKMKDDPEDMAQGGRAGFKDGMSRRKFMQIMGGLAAIPIVGKFFKLGKVATKAAPIVKTPPVPGKPEWFDALVNKVIAEGEDVTKQFATKEREIVHRVNLEGTADKTKKFETYDDSVYVYRDLDDGTVRVEYNSLDNMSEAPVNLTFKPGMADEATKGKPADTFQADEIVPESRMVGPDDFEIEDAVDEFDNVVDLNSDVSKLKQFAGEKLTTKEIVEGINKRKRSRAIVEDSSEAADFMTSRQGDYDPSPDDFASGGIARMLGE